tara:strand:- start:464 stop:850 length:387 start_codon:yes stop_codon:yes gene_type:complete
MDENMLSEDGEWWWDGSNWLPVEDTDSETSIQTNQLIVNNARSVNPIAILFAGGGLFFFNIYLIIVDEASIIYLTEQLLWLGFFLILSCFDVEKITFERITNLDWKVLGFYFIIITLGGLVIFSSSTN